MYLFLFIGLFTILAPFLSADLRKSSRASKGIAFGICFLVGGVFVYIGADRFYKDFFESYPSVPVKKYTDDLFEKHNVIKDSSGRGEVLSLPEENTVEYCTETYCRNVSEKFLFSAADLDSNFKVTRKELHDLINMFDLNKDGLINFPEAGIKTIFSSPKESEIEFLQKMYPTVYGKDIPR